MFHAHRATLPTQPTMSTGRLLATGLLVAVASGAVLTLIAVARGTLGATGLFF